ncbi:MAG: hypothetical protein RLZZ142_966 [Verrucomicrobiota bacterium]
MRNSLLFPSVVLCAALWLDSSASLRGASASSKEITGAREWARRSVFPEAASMPFRFMLGGNSSSEVLPHWQCTETARELDSHRRERTRLWSDPASGLQVRIVATEYTDFPVVEWTLWVKNQGTADSALLEDIRGLDVLWERGEAGEFVLHGVRGDSCVAESFRPYAQKLGPGTVKRCSPPVSGEKVSGKSSDGPDGWPYWNLQWPGGGVILAVGWPGQWEAVFSRDQERGVRVRAGQQLTRLVLKPGEEIRTPSTTLLFWEGDDVVRAQNLWRAWYLAHVLPRVGGEPQPPVTQIQVDGSLANWSRVQKYVDANIKPDICWRDAGGSNPWYPIAGGPFSDPKKIWLNTGTWEVDPEKYPQGFKPFSDKVRALGMQFLLWFEPERVGNPNSWLGRNHPEWLLPGNSAGDVLNLGDPAALQWLTEHIHAMIQSQGLDWYREDLNGGNYGTAWRRKDAPDRQGMTENQYVQGHLAFWDALRRRNPGLRIDSCASGGRRNDLETMRRAVPLLRSDWSVTAFAKEPLQVEGNQAQTFGLSSWLPWQGAGVPFLNDPYAVRSYYLAGFGMVSAGDWTQSDAARANTIRGYTEARRVAPLLFGDYYPLTPYRLDRSSWMAWQFHRPDRDEAVVQAFRRPESTEETLTVKLRGLDPERRYAVENLDGGREVRRGEELLRGVELRLPERPAALVLLIKAVP